MANVSKENSTWVEWVRTAAGLAYTQKAALTQGGPRDRHQYNQACANDELHKLSLDPNPDGPCWWDVQVFGWMNVQQITAPGLNTLLDPRGNGIQNVPLRGWLKYLGCEVDFDVGRGAHFSVFAPSVSVGVTGPTGMLPVGLQSQSNFTGTPIAPLNVVSCAVNGIVSACARPASLNTVTLTETRVLTGTVDIPVPARARTLQIFQDTASLPAAPMNWVSDTTTGFDLGEIDFDTPTAPGRTSILEVPMTASIVRTGAQARNVTLIWGLAL